MVALSPVTRSFSSVLTTAPMRPFPLLATVLALPALAAQTPAPAPGPAVALVGGTLVNPGTASVRNAVVVTRGARIVCAGPRARCAVPSGARVVDVRGAFIAPGFIDAHVHYSQTGWVDGRPDAFDLRDEMPYETTIGQLQREPARFHRAFLCSGVTSVFDVGGFPWTFDLARSTVSATDAPRVVAAGPLLTTIDHWLNLTTMRQFVFLRSDSVVRSTVRAQAATGAEAIKVWYINLPDSVRARMRPLLELTGEEAKRAGLPLIVHATELHTAKEALGAGATVLVHSVERDTIDAEFIGLAKRNGTILIPTLTVREGYADVFLGRSPAARYPLACVDPSTRAKLQRVIPDARRQRQIAVVRSGSWDRQRAVMDGNLRRLRAAGIPIAMGTDAGNPGTAHGPSIYREMEAMQAAGMTASEVLASSTIVAARAMGLARETGSIERGKRADVVVLDADPTVDIENARRLRWVMRNGALHRAATLRHDP